MNIIISKISGALYRGIVKPILFKQSPDKVHERMITMGAKVQKSAFLCWLMRASWNYENRGKLSQTIHGVTFKNPLGLSAGLDKNFEIPGVVNAIGFGQMEGGSITFKPCKGNDKPWFYRLPKTKSIVVHVGLANHGAAKILPRIAKYDAKMLGDMPINISVAKTNNRENATDAEAIADYVGTVKMIAKQDVGDLVTLNISCPNTYGGEPFTTPKRLDNLLTEIDKIKLRKPVFVKMPIDKSVAEFEKLLDVIVKHNVQGVTISNLFKDRWQVELADDLPVEVKGNLSGRPTFAKSNELIAATYRKYGDKLTISGVGGVFDANDAYTKIRSGASLVQMVTALMFEGPQVVGQINRGLVKLLERDGFSHISDAIGVDVRK